MSLDDKPGIPSQCWPRRDPGAVPFIFDGKNTVPVAEPVPTAGFQSTAIFDVKAIMLIDGNNDGAKEAYGVGILRTDDGGSQPAYRWWRNGDFFDVRKNNSTTYDIGLNLGDRNIDEQYSSILIRLNDWTCTVLAYKDGNLTWP